MMNKNHTILFVLLSAVFIVSTSAEPYPFSWLVKILPIVLLIFISWQHRETRSERFFLIGLIFSVFGDFFLDYAPDKGFIFGLGSFLIAHLFYIISLMPIEKKRLFPVLGYLVFGVAIFSVIMPGLGQLFVPVLMYMSVLLLMGVFTLVSKKSNKWLVLGGLSFALSDSLLGFNKFYTPVVYSHFIIMLTYYFAQFALVKGMFNHPESVENL